MVRCICSVEVDCDRLYEVVGSGITSWRQDEIGDFGWDGRN